MRKPPKTRAETAQATRKALIRAGIAEFSRQGFDASLDSICARAKLTRGAFYVHFADRDAFIVAVMQHVLGTFVSAITGAQPATASTAAAIEVFFAAARADAPVVRGAAGLRFHHLIEACRRTQVIGDTYRGLLRMGRDQLASVVVADQDRGDLRDDVAAPALADLMLVAALGVIAALELELPIDIARVGDTMRGLLAP